MANPSAGEPPKYADVVSDKQQTPYPAGPPGGQMYPPQGQGYPPPQGQGYPPPQGYPPAQGGVMYPSPQGGYAPGPYVGQQTASTVVVTTPGVIGYPGQCPVCTAGVLVESFSCCGIILAIVFFPLGILCCLFMRERRCTNCGATF